MSSKTEMVEVDVELKRELERCYIVKDHLGREHVLPKSITERDGSTWLIPEWLAMKDGLI